MNVALGWAKYFMPDSPAIQLAELRQQVAGLQLEITAIERERDEISRQRDELSLRLDQMVNRELLDKAVRELDNMRDQRADAIRVLTREGQQ